MTRQVIVFGVLVLACAAYIGASLSVLTADYYENPPPLAPLIDAVALLVPVLTCGVVQYLVSRPLATTSSQLWLPVIGTAIGAPVLGGFVMLIVSFAIFGKQP